MKDFKSYQKQIQDLLHVYKKGCLSDDEFISYVDNNYTFNNHINLDSVFIGLIIGTIIGYLLKTFIDIYAI